MRKRFRPFAVTLLTWCIALGGFAPVYARDDDVIYGAGSGARHEVRGANCVLRAIRFGKCFRERSHDSSADSEKMVQRYFRADCSVRSQVAELPMRGRLR
jgi:hypothetical protein